MADNPRHYFEPLTRYSLALLLVFFIFSQTLLAPDSEAKSTKAADFSLKDLQGHTVKFSHFKGQVVLVNFWATWCAPCRAEIPDLLAVYEQYKTRGFAVIGISLDEVITNESKKMLEDFINKAGITYPVLMGNDVVYDAYGGIYAIPTSYLIDSKGNIINKYMGLLKRDTLEKDLLPILKNKGNYKIK